MFKTFRKTIEKIIVKYGTCTIEEFYKSPTKYIKIEKPNFLDFVIEKQGNILFAGYSRKINGDLVSDPVFIFELQEENGELIWFPTWCEQVLMNTHIGYFNEEGKYIYFPSRLKDVRSFATSCAKEWHWYYLAKAS